MPLENEKVKEKTKGEMTKKEIVIMLSFLAIFVLLAISQLRLLSDFMEELRNTNTIAWVISIGVVLYLMVQSFYANKKVSKIQKSASGEHKTQMDKLSKLPMFLYAPYYFLLFSVAFVSMNIMDNSYWTEHMFISVMSVVNFALLVILLIDYFNVYKLKFKLQKI